MTQKRTYRRYDEASLKSIVVMDNVRFHQKSELDVLAQT